MAEQVLSLHTAAKNLNRLSQQAESERDRFVITAAIGKPQSVLLSYQEYMGMKETIALFQKPETLAQIDQSLHDIAIGNRIPWRQSNDNAISAIVTEVPDTEFEDSRSSPVPVSGSHS